MKVSVIIPVRNEASRIVDAVDKAWAAGADEVIVCDALLCFGYVVSEASTQHCHSTAERKRFPCMEGIGG